MSPEELARAISGLSGHLEKILLFGWYLHVHKDQAHFQPEDIKVMYDTLHIAAPSSPIFDAHFQQLVTHRALLKNSSGYRLEYSVREELDAKHGSREITVQITELLLSLPEKIPDLAERTYLDEALICYKHGAFRAAVVMAWNLAYHHLCSYVLKHRLADFNARWLLMYPADHRKGTKAIVVMDDFSEELKESKLIEICNSAGIITNAVRKILIEKLGRRNSAAHPSGVSIGQLQAEEFIDDLVKNVVLKLA